MGGTCSSVALLLLELMVGFKLLWLDSALAWGTQNLMFFTLVSEDVHKQSAWDFGQLLPVILLAQPILSFAQGFYGKLST